MEIMNENGLIFGKKGCIWEIMILKKGSLGDNKNNVEREFLVEHKCIIHYLLMYIA